MGNDYRIRLRRSFGVRLYVLLAAWGAIEAVGTPVWALYLLVGWMMASTVTSWCVVDSHILGRPMLRITHEMTFLIWPAAVPLYLIWSRRFRGLGITLLHAVGLTVICTVAFIVTALLKYGPAGLEAMPK